MEEPVVYMVAGGALALVGRHIAGKLTARYRAAKKYVSRLFPGHGAAAHGRCTARRKTGGRR